LPFIAVVIPPPTPPGFPNAVRAERKTRISGTQKRARWVDADGSILEWDYQHGRIEKYNARGEHQGEFDPDTGEMVKGADPTRKVEP
jgi:hypothetical protein